MRWSLLIACLAGLAAAQDSSSTETTNTITDASTVETVTTPVSMPSGTYEDVSTTITLSDSTVVTTTHSNATMTSGNQTIVSTTTDSITLLTGGGHTTTLGNNSMNATATTATNTATNTPVVNTRPCNGYAEFCTKKYSNITMVTAHNSPFVRKNNVAANQALDVTSQLNDGIRMLQFQTHYENDTMYLCHTTCELLNVGTLEAYLTEVNTWMRKNPYDVVTFMIGNYDYVNPENFTTPIYNAGLKDLIYTPTKVPMALDDWPTLSDMILRGKRAVFFMDYQANQTALPWLMDEFSQMWETPFSPTNKNFPCTVQRPPGLSEANAKKRLYMANHNLNLQLNLGSLSLLIPNTAELNVTNGVSGEGSLGWMAENCTKKWDRPPNFLLVDYYNYGTPNGTVFEVAADMNNVTWDGKCCGKASAAPRGVSVASLSSLLLVAVGVQMIMSVF
ncbi:hypothetical protein N7508_008117 [Penicillium antarcticum]|uniref:uncharacterized protein n=1 Tax=Penicillium antarcticum TaxID=416450 RepID=UPI0023934EC9|nr:uncharacterized protein N7508_008117 [Penicillium antarcticum]KAJ5297868.1 hypothetical protein N7508_008117 [Penicillium antarcticum]